MMGLVSAATAAPPLTPPPPHTVIFDQKYFHFIKGKILPFLGQCLGESARYKKTLLSVKNPPLKAMRIRILILDWFTTSFLRKVEKLVIFKIFFSLQNFASFICSNFMYFCSFLRPLLPLGLGKLDGYWSNYSVYNLEIEYPKFGFNSKVHVF